MAWRTPADESRGRTTEISRRFRSSSASAWKRPSTKRPRRPHLMSTCQRSGPSFSTCFAGCGRSRTNTRRCSPLARKRSRKANGARRHRTPRAVDPPIASHQHFTLPARLACRVRGRPPRRARHSAAAAEHGSRASGPDIVAERGNESTDRQTDDPARRRPLGRLPVTCLDHRAETPTMLSSTKTIRVGGDLRMNNTHPLHKRIAIRLRDDRPIHQLTRAPTPSSNRAPPRHCVLRDRGLRGMGYPRLLLRLRHHYRQFRLL